VAITALVVALAASAFAQSASQATLAGTSWQLVRFQGGDDTVVTPDDGSRYTIAFAKDGTIAARIDCNRGRGSWTSAGPGRVELGPLALTRAFCGSPSMHDQIVKHWSSIRSYVVRDRHLFLSLMADGGIYEFAPAAPVAPAKPAAPLKSPVPPLGPVTFTCASGEPLRGTFYRTQPALVLLERGGVFRPAFQVKAASGTRYEGDGVLFWEARGEVTLVWMGAEASCKRG
jgi:heat shock protein HslJ